MRAVYLSIGGNLGNRMDNLNVAIRKIRQNVGEIIIQSPVYETQAWGIKDQPDFLNQVILVQTYLTAQQVLQEVLNIEKKMGRLRTRKWYTRLIDIDILLYDDEVIKEENLIIPHPFMSNRNFVLKPLVDIAPLLLHPTLNKTILELYEECSDSSSVIPYH